MVVKQSRKQQLYEMGHVLSAVEIEKAWTANEVIANLTSCFDGKIPEDTSYVQSDT